MSEAATALASLTFLVIVAFGLYAVARGLGVFATPEQRPERYAQSSKAKTAVEDPSMKRAARAAAVERLHEEARRAQHADDIPAMEAVLSEARSLNLNGGEFSMHRIEGILDLMRLKASFDDPRDQSYRGAPLYLDEPVACRKRDGRLRITSDAVIFEGGSLIDLPWRTVMHTDVSKSEDGYELSIQQAGRRTPDRFTLPWFSVAVRAEYLCDRFKPAESVVAVNPGRRRKQDPPPVDQPAAPPVVATPQVASAVGLDEELDFETDVVGESFDERQDSLRSIVERESRSPEGVRFTARLVPEPENAFDCYAVAVTDAHTGAMLGHLARQLAKQYQPAVIAALKPVEVPAVVRGETRCGVWLDLTRFNAAAGLPAPEQLLERAESYFDQRAAVATVDGVGWEVHRAHAAEAATIGQHDVAADAFAKALQGWLAAMEFEGRPPCAAGIFEEYTRWCRKAKRPELELEILRRYADAVAAHEVGSTRHERLMGRLDAISAPF